MFKFVIVITLAVAYVSAAPRAVLSAPTHSSQVIDRNYNGLAAPLIATSPYVAASVAAPFVRAARMVKAAAPLVTAPTVEKAAPLAAPTLVRYTVPFAHYQAAPVYHM